MNLYILFVKGTLRCCLMLMSFKMKKTCCLTTYIDQLKYKDFISNPKKEEDINFDMIYARCGRRPQQYSDKHYQTVRASDVFKMSQKEKKKAVSACLCSERKYLFVQKKLILSHVLET